MIPKSIKLSQACNDGFNRKFFSPVELVKYLQGHPEERLEYLKFLNFCKESGIDPKIKKQRIDF